MKAIQQYFERVGTWNDLISVSNSGPERFVRAPGHLNATARDFAILFVTKNLRMSNKSLSHLEFAMSFLCPTRVRIALRLPHLFPQRCLSGVKPKKQGEKKKKGRTQYNNQDLSKGIQFSLCDAMRYVISLRSRKEKRALTTPSDISKLLKLANCQP